MAAISRNRNWWTNHRARLYLRIRAAWCTNTWDLPTYGLLVALVLVLRLLPSGGDGFWATLRSLRWADVRNLVIAAALTFAGAYALYLPFHAKFQNFVSGTGPVTTPTNPAQFVTLFGLWLFLAASFFFLELRDRVERIFGASNNGTQRLALLALASACALDAGRMRPTIWLKTSAPPSASSVHT